MHSRGDNIECRRLLEQAVALDPDYEGALAMLGWANYAGIRWDFFDETERAGGLARLQEIIKILLAIDPDHGDGHFLTCALKIIECDLNGAIEAGEKAVAKKPNDPNTHAYLAQTYSYAGRSSEALSRLNYVMRLSPHYPTWMLGTIASILYRTGKYAEAIEYARRSVNRAPDSIPWQAQLTAFYGAREQVVEGEAALARLYELDPQYTLTKFRKIHQAVDAKYYDILRNGLQKLGVPE
jgi:adenylate cyclase